MVLDSGGKQTSLSSVGRSEAGYVRFQFNKCRLLIDLMHTSLIRSAFQTEIYKNSTLNDLSRLIGYWATISKL